MHLASYVIWNFEQLQMKLRHGTIHSVLKL